MVGSLSSLITFLGRSWKMVIIIALIASPLFGPLVTICGFLVMMFLTQKIHSKNITDLTNLIEKRLEKDEQQDDKIKTLEKEVAVLKTEVDGMSAKLMAEITNLKDLVKSLRDSINRH